MSTQTQKRSAQLLFASNMKRIRLDKKLTQESVAEGAGLHPNYISSVEQGERNISIGNIERIACALRAGLKKGSLIKTFRPGRSMPSEMGAAISTESFRWQATIQVALFQALGSQTWASADQRTRSIHPQCEFCWH
jgi:transcriptional regulator with XRE-family HTH domain